MNRYLVEFEEYLKAEKRMAKNSLEAYLRDASEFQRLMEEKQIFDLREANEAEVVSFLLRLRQEGRSSATVNRKAASVRAFFQFMNAKSYMTENPALHIKAPRIERKEIEFLTLEEVERLLATPDDSTKGLRDRAMLELLYATGIRVSEAVESNVDDVNLRIGFITCSGQHGKARIVPLGRPSRAAMEAYVYEGREKLLRDPEKKKTEKALFLNYTGERMSRQGMWKLLREYADKAGLESKLTPQTLRNTFAVHMVQNGADLKSLQELMGHEDISATEIYLSVTKNRIKDVYDRTHPRA